MTNEEWIKRCQSYPEGYRKSLDEEMDKDLRSWCAMIRGIDRKIQAGEPVSDWERGVWEDRDKFDWRRIPAEFGYTE